MHLSQPTAPYHSWSYLIMITTSISVHTTLKLLVEPTQHLFQDIHWYCPNNPMPTQFQYMTPAPAFEETHLAGDQSEWPTTQLDTDITASHLATSQVESWGQHFHKTRQFDLSACECGHEVSNTEIEKGDTIMQCKVPGCETVWVSH